MSLHLFASKILSSEDTRNSSRDLVQISVSFFTVSKQIIFKQGSANCRKRYIVFISATLRKNYTLYIDICSCFVSET